MATPSEVRFVNGITEEQAQTRHGIRRKLDLGLLGRINKDLLVFKLYYFFTFTGLACVKPFLPVFYRHVGMSAEQTGMILGLQPVARLIGAPLFGGLADKYRKHRVVMVLMCIVSTALSFSLVFVSPSEVPNNMPRNLCINGSQSNISERENFSGDIWPCRGSNCSLMHSVLGQNCGDHSDLNLSENVNNKELNFTRRTRDNTRTFIIMCTIHFMSSFFGSFNSLGDAATIKYLTAIDRGADYGKQRLWGAVGWGTIAVASGLLLKCIAQPRQSEPPTQFDCKIFDGAVIVHCLPVTGVITFDDYAENVFIPHICIQSSRRVDVVWDTYVRDSLKESTREKRGKGIRRKVAGGTKLPPNWMQFLRDSVNKEELFAFLTNKVAEYNWPENKTVYITSGFTL